MSWRNLPNRPEEYRKRAEECRAQADQTDDAEMRKNLLETAGTWERMAEYEDVHNPRPLERGGAPTRTDFGSET